MVELVIGFVFILVGAFVTFICMGIGEVFPTLIGIVFVVAGLFVFIKGVKKKIKDNKTEKFGEECFGIVKETKNNGTEVNGVSYQDAYIYTFIPSLNTVKLMKENIGGKYQDYVPGKYVKLKYYEDDINIIGFVSKEVIPQNQLAEFDKLTDVLPSYITSTSNTPLQPMDMPSNGVSYSWNNDNNNNNQN
jgi:hypothetical protein